MIRVLSVSSVWMLIFAFFNLRAHSQQQQQAQIQLKTPLGMDSLRNAGKNFQASDVSDIRRRAQLNDPEALYFLGIMHYYGNAIGVEKNTDQAIRYFKLAADKGHLSAQVNLGMLLIGEPTNVQNTAQAITYFTRAAENGDSDAQWCLGRMFYEGRVSRNSDHSRAVHWFSKSADSGNAFGLFHLGIMNEYGLAVKQDFREAARFYKMASAKENLDAKYYLALLHAYGRGYAQDIHKASLLFKEAAEKGHAPSQYYLGVIFLYGQGGFPRDYNMAFYWMTKAANGTSDDTAEAAKIAVSEIQRILVQSQERTVDLEQRFASGPRGGPQNTEHLFARLDDNSDGRISLQEFDAMWHNPPPEVSFFTEDMDSDGFLSWDEFQGPNATVVMLSQ